MTPRMVRRSLVTAALVGSVLFGVNSGDTLARTGFTTTLALKLAVTMLIPFVVSLASSAATRIELGAGGAHGTVCTNAEGDRSPRGTPPDAAPTGHRSDT